MSSTGAVKPPTQSVGVQGFVAFESKPAQPADPDLWARLVTLPPFQMFAAEQMKNASGADSMEHALAYVRANGGGSEIVMAYAEWHGAKGFWKGETPMGEVAEQ